MTKKTTAPKAQAKAAESVALLGSDTLPAILVIGGKDVQLGTIVAAAHTASGLSADQWNALSAEDRDVHLQAQVNALEGQATAEPPAAPAPLTFESLGLADPSGNEGIEGASIVGLGAGAYRVTAKITGHVVETDVDLSTLQTDNVVQKATVINQIVAGLLSQRAAQEPQPDIAPEPLADQAAANAAVAVEVRRLDHARALAELVPQEGPGYGYVWNGQTLHQGVEVLPTNYAEGSIEQFRAEDGRTMRIVSTTAGLAAMAVDS